MNLTDEGVPLEQRLLWLEGLVPLEGHERIRKALPELWPGTALCLFVGYAYADLQLGKVFEYAFPWGHPEQAQRTRAVIYAVTQEFGKALPLIPCGWKTISVIDFPDGVPSVVRDLRVADGWGQPLESCVVICGPDTLEAVGQTTTKAG